MNFSNRFRVVWLLLILMVSINGCKKTKGFFKRPIEAEDIEIIMENIRVDDEGEGEEEGEDETTVEIVKYTITIYVDQPGGGGNRSMYEFGLGGLDTGHAFVKLETEDANGVKNAITLGFYPEVTPGRHTLEVGGHISDDTHRIVDNNYEVSKTYEVIQENFIKAKDYMESIRTSKKKYHANDYNCADFAIQTAKAAGIDVPDTQATWTYTPPFEDTTFSGTASSPGNLGEDLR
ncbi:hypothetical protein [Hwangdonia sp.]|uniref:hypothetical protein n=1 Tax=Hwangdonia sp. TaxID=1883432 RepID=UPI003AB5D601